MLDSVMKLTEEAKEAILKGNILNGPFKDNSTLFDRITIEQVTSNMWGETLPVIKVSFGYKGMDAIYIKVPGADISKGSKVIISIPDGGEFNFGLELV
jgi:hypothetical protein